MFSKCSDIIQVWTYGLNKSKNYEKHIPPTCIFMEWGTLICYVHIPDSSLYLVTILFVYAKLCTNTHKYSKMSQFLT